MGSKTKEETKTIVDEILSMPYKLILHNDDVNSFDFVISCLIEICGHDFVQANQCAHLVHFKGECDVKYGSKSELEDMKERLQNVKLSVTLEKN